jgi:hypothetical protein
LRLLAFGDHNMASIPPCPEAPRTYNAAMLDIKLIREKPDFVREREGRRFGK